MIVYLRVVLCTGVKIRRRNSKMEQNWVSSAF